MHDNTDAARQLLLRLSPPTRHAITFALKACGHSQQSVANTCHVSAATVCEVISGKSISRRVAQHIADLIGLPVEQLWPEKYEQTKRKKNRKRP